ncbi:MAG: tRNA guanosine(34) transglycosylase Tgt [Thermoflavifilum aggregans]|nr:tRNA guanosine(34) transglycosylase Tgt [Thermoflavifilum aggregans]
MAIGFHIVQEDVHTRARAGCITTDHGMIETPIFMPVGTAGAVKTVLQQQLDQDLQAPIILGNTYHLYLRPGTDVLQQAGGLHRFMHWNGALLTDSGGYQVFSLAKIRKITEEGVWFQSHIDGSKHFFSPQRVMEIQRRIGADIVMAFDECTPYPCTHAYARASLQLTHRWLDVCLACFQEQGLYGYSQTIFPIVQGSVYADLRRASAEYIAAKETAGYAIGGLSVGEPEQMMYEMTALVNEILPTGKPRYLMGVGTPWNILESIALGVDMFDCVMPTRNGRNGMLFTWQGIINIRNKKWATDFSVIDEYTTGPVSTYYSKAYLRHLFVSNEISGLQIATLHNLSFYLQLVREARKHILQGDFLSWKNEIIPRLKSRL